METSLATWYSDNSRYQYKRPLTITIISSFEIIEQFSHKNNNNFNRHVLKCDYVDGTLQSLRTSPEQQFARARHCSDNENHSRCVWLVSSADELAAIFFQFLPPGDLLEGIAECEL